PRLGGGHAQAVCALARRGIRGASDLLEADERRPRVHLRDDVVPTLLERETVERLALRAGGADHAVGGLVALALLGVRGRDVWRDLDRDLVGHALLRGRPQELAVSAGCGQGRLSLLVAVGAADTHDPA